MASKLVDDKSHKPYRTVKWMSLFVFFSEEQMRPSITKKGCPLLEYKIAFFAPVRRS